MKFVRDSPAVVMYAYMYVCVCVCVYLRVQVSLYVMQGSSSAFICHHTSDDDTCVRHLDDAMMTRVPTILLMYACTFDDAGQQSW
jgi:hypothetical protein